MKETAMKDSCNRRLCEILGKRNAVLLPGAANALAARVIEDIGFQAIYVTGAGLPVCNRIPHLSSDLSC